jgi:hypothetical protein
VGMALQVLHDPLGTLQRIAREYGDIVRIPIGPDSRILLNHPDYIAQVNVIQQSKFHKSKLTKDVTGRLLGEGLLISEGDFWRRQRRLAQPAFHRSRINEYASTMVESAETQIRKWGDGEERDIAQEMTALTLETAVRTLFGTTLPGEARQVGRSLDFLVRYSLRKARWPIKVPESWPTPANRRAEREIQFLDSLVYRIIDERKRLGNIGEHKDLLSLLMSAMDEDGSQMTAKQLRDETMTLFLAGHETTALTLSWAWFLLSKNPAAEVRLHEELRAAIFVGGGERSAAAVSARVYFGADFHRAVHDWRVRFSGRLDDHHVSMGDATGCALFRRSGSISAGALARRPREPAAGGSVFSIRRRAAAVHRPEFCVDGSGAGDRDDRAEVPASTRCRPEDRTGAAGDAASAKRNSHEDRRAALAPSTTQRGIILRTRRFRHGPKDYR